MKRRRVSYQCERGFKRNWAIGHDSVINREVDLLSSVIWQFTSKSASPKPKTCFSLFFFLFKRMILWDDEKVYGFNSVNHHLIWSILLESWLLEWGESEAMSTIQIDDVALVGLETKLRDFNSRSFLRPSQSKEHNYFPCCYLCLQSPTSLWCPILICIRCNTLNTREWRKQNST